MILCKKELDVAMEKCKQQKRATATSAGMVIGTKVEVRFGDNHRSKWVKGVIAKVQNDSMFDITYSDGTSEKGLKKDFVRLPKERAVKAKKESKASKQSQGPSGYYRKCINNVLFWARKADLAGGEHCIILWHNRQRYYPALHCYLCFE